MHMIIFKFFTRIGVEENGYASKLELEALG